MTKRLKLAVLISGGGSTLANLIARRDRGELFADIELVVSSRPRVRGLEIARDAGIRTEVVPARANTISAREGEEIRDWTAMSRELDGLLARGDFDLVCMAGFLCRYLFADSLAGRVLNIHPALIPMFCGEGMYGRRVHEAVIASGVRISGCTVHLADHAYDSGPIIVQRCCPVYSGDGPEDVAKRVFAEECKAYPAAINLFAEDRVRVGEDGRVHVAGDADVERFGPI